MASFEILPGRPAFWRSSSGGVGAVVTVREVTSLETARIHIVRRSDGKCAEHLVALETLSEAPSGSIPCGCTPKHREVVPGDELTGAA